MQPPQVRPAVASDVSVLAGLNAHVQALHREALPGEFNEPDASAAEGFFTQQMADPEVLVLLAHSADVPLGYLFGEELHRRANPFTTAISVFYVHHMAVTPDARHRGVGRALMLAAEAEAAERGLAGVRLDTWTFNESAHGFFQRLGYTPYNIKMQRLFDPSKQR